jgi:hypothetical protein
VDENRLAREQQTILRDYDDVRQELLALPGVLAVGIGVKETGNQFTEEMSYRVYVAEKKPPEELAPAELVPPRIGEFRTDVLIPLPVDEDSDVCGDERQTLSEHRPLQGGIAISTNSSSYGTLGWFATLDADDTTVLLTNKHVLYDYDDEITTEVKKTAQPQLGSPSTCCCCECGSDNVVGESLIGIRNLTPLTATSVDCAIARITEDLADDILLEITNDSTDEVLTVSGTAAAVVGQNVRKIGARSGFTTGTVIHIGDAAVAPTDPGAPATTIAIRTGQVLIIPVAAETYQIREGVCKFAFSNSGDSGAVILNDDDEIIALNWGGCRTKYTVGLTIANNIQNVVSALGDNGFAITIKTTGDGDGDRERISRRRPAPAPSVEPSSLETLRDANRESVLHELYETHHGEVLDLINHTRPVTIVWHRNQGPAFVAALARSARVENYALPQAIEGCTRAQLLTAMKDVLLKHGSASLKRDIARHGTELYEALIQGRTVEETALRLRTLGYLDSIASRLSPKVPRDAAIGP